MVQDYNLELGIIKIGKNQDNICVLSGKLVEFEMSLNEVVKKINAICEYELENKFKKYTVELIKVSCIDNVKYDAYIIY